MKRALEVESIKKSSVDLLDNLKAMADRVPETSMTLRWGALFNVGTRRVHITIPILIMLNIARDFTSRHSLLAFIIPVLLAFLQIRTVGPQPPPFQVHPVTTTASVIGVLGYYLSFGARSWLPRYASQLSFAGSLLGAFSVASLASLLLPPCLWNLRFVFYVMLMLPEILPSLRKIYNHYERSRRQPLRMRRALPCLLLRTMFNVAHDFTSRHYAIAFVIPALLAFLQVQTVGTQPSPFDVHPVTSTASVIGVLSYYLSFGAKGWLPPYASELSFAMSLLGAFSVASLASLLLPRSLWNFRFVLYVTLMLVEFLPSLRKIYDHYVRRRHCRRQPLRLRGALPCLLPRTYVDLMGLRQ